MKKKALIFACLLVTHGMSAQAQMPDYRPMAEEGKLWEMQVGLIFENIYDCLIQGDTLIDGENWKKVYKYLGWPVGPAGSENKQYYAAIRDMGEKVYAISKDSNKPRLLYDFGLKEGSLVRCGIESNKFGCLLDTDEQPDTLLGYPFKAYLRVERIDTIWARGQRFRCFTLRLLDAFKEWMMHSDPVIWVEGVGSGFGPFSPWMPLPTEKYSLMIECKVNNEYLFTFPNNLQGEAEPNAVGSTHYNTSKVGNAHDLQGRHLEGVPNKGLYIIDGRKTIVR